MSFIGENSTSKDEKLTNIENLMNKFDSEKNENFAKLMAVFNENSEAVKNLSSITDIINGQNNTNDAKLANIENLINKFDKEKHDNFTRLMEVLQHNSEALNALNIHTGTSFGLEKIE
jgi:ABC-type transporter Mla subunit MlaD